MARAAGPTRTTRSSPAPGRGRRPEAETTAAAGKTAKHPAPKRPAKAPPASPTPKLSKDELRTQIEKLERANASLRAKGREMNKGAKAAAVRIDELELQLADLEGKARSQAAASNQGRKQSRPPARRRGPRELDPGDAVPPGVAVLEPAPLDEEAEVALENLEEHLGRR